MTKKSTPDTMCIVGRNPVREALERQPATIEKVMLLRGGRGLDAFRHAATQAGVPVQYVPAQRLNEAAPGLNHQGIVAVITPLAYVDVDEMLATIAPALDVVQRTRPMLLILDRVEDPYNYGALLRTAVAAGVGGVIVPTNNMAPLSATVIKASAGTATRIPIARVDDLVTVLGQLKERGYWIMGTAGEGTTSVWEADWDRPLALVMGSEGQGMHPRVAATCDYLVSIPMRGDAESLNVSVAAGILLFAAARTRMEENLPDKP